ncbi:hypothetical protein GCM10010468_70860 [Actinocorallia longicatena]|uniref:Uncharacterized protein n=1 Tax=Actinocorallia longicatena TaxID=111803 RepID=A0ABP6QJW3_9ACTN
MRYIRSPAPYGQATNRSPVSPGRPAYPRATWTPATYSAPATPAGTGCNASSSTYSRVLAIGRPNGTVPGRSTSTAPEATITVVSVGP